MRPTTRLLLLVGLALECLLALFPPMRATLAPETGRVFAGVTRHFFVFSELRGPWTVDVGRFIAYSTLVATATAIGILVEFWLRASKKTPAADVT